MTIQRTITILLPDDEDVRKTLVAFQSVQQSLSPICFNEGKPIGALQLHREHYHQVKGNLSAQMTITAMRLVSGAYVSAKKGYLRRLQLEARRKSKFEYKGWNYKPRHIKELSICEFKNHSAMFLVGSRGRDASFFKEGIVSLWTKAGRKKLPYILPKAFQQTFNEALEIDSLTVIERNGKLYGRVVLTLDVPEPRGINPVGIDLGETNALVAVNPDGETLFISGKENKVRGKRTYKTRNRLQRKLASHKAQKRNTRSVRKALKRLGRKTSNRTRSFCRESAKRLCDFAGINSVLVFEDLNIPRPVKGAIGSKATRRRLTLWQYGLMLQSVRNRAERDGIAVVLVDPAFTSQNCSRCGLRGKRKRHKFLCPHCTFAEHADINAAMNIRDRFTVLRDGGEQSISPEALENALVVDSKGELSH